MKFAAINSYSGKILFLLIFFCLSAPLQAAFEEKGAGSLYLGRGSSGIASDDSMFSALLNPAKLAALKKARLDFSFRNFYQLADLNQLTLTGVFPSFPLPSGFAISRYGNKLYSEIDTRLSAAYCVTKDFYLGFSLNGYWLAIKNYGQSASFGFDLAGWYHLRENLSAAFLLENLNEPTIGAAKEKLPVQMVLGLAFSPADNLELNIDVVKENRFAFEFRFGLQYRINRWLGLVSGFREQSNTFSLGFYLNTKHIIFSYALEYHQTLSNSHSLSVGYEF